MWSDRQSFQATTEDADSENVENRSPLTNTVESENSGSLSGPDVRGLGEKEDVSIVHGVFTRFLASFSCIFVLSNCRSLSVKDVEGSRGIAIQFFAISGIKLRESYKFVFWRSSALLL